MIPFTVFKFTHTLTRDFAIGEDSPQPPRLKHSLKEKVFVCKRERPCEGEERAKEKREQGKERTRKRESKGVLIALTSTFIVIAYMLFLVPLMKTALKLLLPKLVVYFLSEMFNS